MTDVQKDVHITEDESPKAQESSLIEALKTASRLVPRQINDEIALAKLELEHKKARVGGVAIAAGIVLVFTTLLVIALVVAAIAGLATIMPLWLSALLVSATFLVIIGLGSLIGYRKFKSLLPLLPEQAWRGIRYDVGIAKEGRDFDPATLETEPLTKEEKKALKAEAEEAAAKARAERAAKEAEHGPKASETELIKRTSARRAHLLTLREELVDQADVKKQAGYLIDNAKGRAVDAMNQAAAGAAEQAGHAVETVKERWKPLTVLAVSAGACAVLLRKLLKK